MSNSFEKTLTAMQFQIHENNCKVGWWDKTSEDTVPAKLCLIHSEISEAMEGHRKDLMDDHLPDRPMIEVELADAVIRILDLAEHLGLNVGAALVDKLAYNQTRADHKRENRNAPGGKAY